MEKRNKVAVVDVGESVKEAVFRGLDLIGSFKPFEGARVVIKPNLCSSFRSSWSGVTTDVRVVDALIKYLLEQEKDLQVTVVEGDGERGADEAFQRLGYLKLREKYGVSFVNLSRDVTYKMLLPDGRKLRTLEISRTLLLMDYFISVGKLKRHVFEKVTCIWKNQYGCIPSKQVRFRLHPFLSEVLFDLNSVLFPDLAIIDAITSLAGGGPLEGEPVCTDRIICGNNPLSIDIVASRIMGTDPWKVPHLKYALKHGFQDGLEYELLGDVSRGGDKRREVKPVEVCDFSFISRWRYFLYRASLKFRRIAQYFENLGDVFSALAFAIRSIGFSQLAGGEALPSRGLIREALDLLLKVEASERLRG